MAQRVNPIIYRLGKTKFWNSQYFENKITEHSYYDFRQLEIKKFIYKFFKNNGFKIHNCKLNYSANNSLNLFISYYRISSSLKFIENNNHTILKKKLNKRILTHKDYFNYCKIFYIQKLLHNNYNENELLIIKKKFKKKYYNSPNFLQNYIFFKNYHTIHQIKLNFFLNNFFKSLNDFLQKKINIFITFQELNKNIKKKLNKNNIKFLKKNVTKLNRYKQNDFFAESINTTYLCTKFTNSANLLAEFIALQLKKNKRHNFFLTFLKKCLIKFKKEKSFKFNEIKIQIKGRLNKRPRANKKVFKIAKRLPILSIKANIDYAEKVAYTSNGTLGVKVWIYN